MSRSSTYVRVELARGDMDKRQYRRARRRLAKRRQGRTVWLRIVPDVTKFNAAMKRLGEAARHSGLAVARSTAGVSE